MARIRTVKPEFFRDEDLQDLEAAHSGKYPMLVFSGLWGHCDKQGVFEWRPRTLKLDILPFLPFDMGETMELLRSQDFVRKYEIEGREYGFIPTFDEHQRISGKELEQPAKYPAPTKEVIEKHQGSTREAPGSAGREGKGKEGNGEDIGLKPDLKALRSKAVEVLAFLNEKTGRNYGLDGVNVDLIVARLKEGASTDDCRQVVAKKVREWNGDEKMAIYLRPKTLFNRTNFAQYRGELVA